MVVKVGVGKTMVKQPFGYRKTLQFLSPKFNMEQGENISLDKNKHRPKPTVLGFHI